MSAAQNCHTFSCKAALVEALIDCAAPEIEERFEVIMASPHVMAILKSYCHEIIKADCSDDNAVWASISRAAAHKPLVVAALSRLKASIAGRIGVILRIVRSLPEADATGYVATQAHAICLIAHDALASLDRDDGPDTALTALILCTIDWILADTTQDSKLSVGTAATLPFFTRF